MINARASVLTFISQREQIEQSGLAPKNVLLLVNVIALPDLARALVRTRAPADQPFFRRAVNVNAAITCMAILILLAAQPKHA